MENVIEKWLMDNYDSGYCDGYGYGSGRGYGDGSGDGSGSGSGSGSEVKSISGKTIYQVDEIPTAIDHIKESFAKGFILNGDFTLLPCYIAKGNGYFAHGKTLRDARDSLRAKIFENMDPEEAIETFLDKFKKGIKYAGTEFFEWHHYLTGSCLMGRESFVRNKNLDINAMYTVEEFIDICKDDYGSNIINELKERWCELYGF